jgi:hypothetical protein
VVTVNWLMAILNLMPLLPTDGYFLLTTLTRDTNIRTRAWAWLSHPLRSPERPSWFVLAYIAGTIWLLASTLWNHVWRVLDISDRLPFWQSLISLFLVTMFVTMIARAFRRSRHE